MRCCQRFPSRAPASLTRTCHFEPMRHLISSTTRHKHSRDVETVEAKYASHLKIFRRSPIRLPAMWEPHRGSAAQWLTLVKRHVWKREDLYLFIYLFYLFQFDLLVSAAQLIRGWLLILLSKHGRGGTKPHDGDLAQGSEPSGAGPAWLHHIDQSDQSVFQSGQYNKSFLVSLKHGPQYIF